MRAETGKNLPQIGLGTQKYHHCQFASLLRIPSDELLVQYCFTMVCLSFTSICKLGLVHTHKLRNNYQVYLNF